MTDVQTGQSVIMADDQIALTVDQSAQETPESWLGFDSSGWVSLAMLLLIGIMIWKKVPQLIGKGLDGYTQRVRAELDEAERLRKEAEELLASYQAKAAQASDDAKAIVANAQSEAERLVSDARQQVEEAVARRTRLAEDKISAAERAATDMLRSRAADLAVNAAEKILLQKSDSATLNRMTDEAISELDRRLH